MAEVQWIKIYTDMASNKKIKRIRKMPEGNNIVLIWVLLLLEAGKTNNNGSLFLADTIPFKADDLAIEFDFDIDVIKLALLALENYKMIEVFEDVIYIRNWEEYQNVDGLDKLKLQNKLRVAKFREKQRLNTNSNVTCNVTVTQCNATEEDKEVDKEKEYKKNMYADFFGENKELLKTLKEFGVMRTRIKKPLTDKAKYLLCNKLLKLEQQGQNIIECINQSIFNGWSGVFEVKQQLNEPKERWKALD